MSQHIPDAFSATRTRSHGLPVLLFSLAGSLLIGSLVAGTVLLDGLLERSLVFGNFSIEKPFPYALTIALLLALGGAALASTRSVQLFAYRHEIAITALLAVGAVNGLNIESLDPTDPVILVAVYAWVIFFVFERQPFRVPTTVLVLCLAVLCCSVLSAANGGMSTLLGHRTLIVRFLLVLLLASWIAATGRTRYTAKLIIVMAVISAVVGVATSVIFMGSGEVLSSNDAELEIYKSTPLGRMVRATGFLPTAQCLAHLLLFGVSLALFVPMRRMWRIVAVLLMIAGIGFTFTVGGYLALACVLTVWLFLRWPEKSLHLILGIAGIGCVAYLTGWGAYINEEFIQALGGKGTQDRATTLTQGLVAIKHHPWVGVGLRNTFRVTPSFVHSTYLQLASEIGVAGAVAFAGLVCYPIARLAAAVKGTPRGERQSWLKALLLASFTLALHLSIEPFYDNYLSWAFIGVTAGAIGEMNMARSRPLSIARGATTRALG